MNNKRLCALVAISLTVSLFAMTMAGNALGDTGTGGGSRDAMGYVIGTVKEVFEDTISGAKILEMNSGKSTISNSHGHFNLSVPVGDLVILITADHYKDKYENVTLENENETLDLDMCYMAPNPGNLEGHVIDSKTSEPVEGANVTYTVNQYINGKVATDADGHFRFDDIPKGSVILNVECDGYYPEERTEEIYSDETTKDDKVKIEKIPDDILNPKGTFGLIIRDDDNDPIEGVEVTIEGNGFSDKALTDSQGKVKFIQLKEGNYIVSMKKDGYLSHNSSFPVTRGDHGYSNWTLDKDDGTALLDKEVKESFMILAVIIVLAVVIPVIVVSVLMVRRKKRALAKAQAQTPVQPAQQPPQYQTYPAQQQGQNTNPYPTQYQYQDQGTYSTQGQQQYPGSPPTLPGQ